MTVKIEIWGNNIWYLFHTLAYKIKEEYFLLVKNDLIEIVKKICSNLPCPECSNDAIKTINKINFNTINTKNDFELMLFNFHNYVNRKINKPEFKYENLHPKYKYANIHNILNNFKIIFNKNSNNPYMMHESLSRKLNYPTVIKLINKVMLYIE